MQKRPVDGVVLHALASDWSETLRSSDWENGSIGSFLDAAAAWAETSRSGLRYYDAPSNPWRRVGDILIAGKEYE
ncbi:DUF7660 family protein [Paraburkholderia bannensis]